MASTVFTQADAQRLLNSSANGVVRIPDGVTEIEQNAFRECTNLTSVQFPNGLTEIGWYALSGCINLTKVQLPSLTKTGRDSFDASVEIVRVDEVNSQMHAGSQVMGGLICTVWQELLQATDSLEAAMQQDLIRVAGEVCEDGKYKRWV